MHIYLQEVLDADDKPLRNLKGQLMARDIVQFVPFKSFQHSQGSLVRNKNTSDFHTYSVYGCLCYIFVVVVVVVFVA